MSTTKRRSRPRRPARSAGTPPPSDLLARVAALEFAVDTLRGKLAANDAAPAVALDALGAMRADSAGRFDRLEARFDRLEQVVLETGRTIDERFKGVQERLEDLVLESERTTQSVNSLLDAVLRIEAKAPRDGGA